MQSDSPQGRGAGVVREYQAQAAARLIGGSGVQKFKAKEGIFVLKLQTE
jgi:hypothetical protein